MKKIIRIFFLTAISIGIVNLVQAQRGRDSRGGGGGNEGRVSRAPSRSYSAPSRSMTYRQNAPSRTYNNRTITNRNAYRSNIVARTPTRNTNVYNSRNTIVSRNGYARGGSTYRGGYVNNYRGASSIYRPYYGNVYGHRTAFMYGTRYRFIPRSFISINFGGYPYYYNSGFYYGYYNGFYQPMFPPFGLRLGILPFGYSSFYMGGYPYYYYNGIYYQQYGDNDGYQVVDAPLGATVSSLPGGATSVVVNGENLYELNGTYYKASQDSNGNNVFTVVGKNGVINNTTNTTDGQGNVPQQENQSYAPQQDNQSYAPQQQQQPPVSNVAPQASSQMQIGDTMSQLPDGAKLVNIDGQQLYQTPDNIYLKGELNNGVVQFRVVGK